MTADFKAYVQALVAECRDVTFHGEYNVDVFWADKPDKDDDEKCTCYARIKSDPVYLWASITFPGDV